MLVQRRLSSCMTLLESRSAYFFQPFSHDFKSICTCSLYFFISFLFLFDIDMLPRDFVHTSAVNCIISLTSKDRLTFVHAADMSARTSTSLAFATISNASTPPQTFQIEIFPSPHLLADWLALRPQIDPLYPAQRGVLPDLCLTKA